MCTAWSAWPRSDYVRPSVLREHEHHRPELGLLAQPLQNEPSWVLLQLDAHTHRLGP
jgi:hypothetical protein